MKKNVSKVLPLKAVGVGASFQWILTSDIDFSVPLSFTKKDGEKRFYQDHNPVYFGLEGISKVESKFYGLGKFDINFLNR